MITDLQTPCLLLERGRMERNIARFRTRMAGLGAGIRPHLKTCKSREIARLMMPSPAGPATVSTLREAEEFAACGVRDIVYAVGITPAKLDRVLTLRRQGVDLAVILDSAEQADAVAARSRATGIAIPALVEIDSDNHRGGIAVAHSERLLNVARRLHDGGELRGVLTHYGMSYHAQGVAALEAAAEAERQAAVSAAAMLRAAGLPCPVISVGSTPTAHFARDLSGVTEVRAGVYVFFDLMMADLGVCTLDDIAISVLATVIGHRPAEGTILTDSGWMALSRDGGDGRHGFGLVCDAAGRPLPGLVVKEMSQEHGVLAMADGGRPPKLAIGTLLRILPNHACATASQFDGYHVVNGNSEVEGYWLRFRGF